MTVHDDPRLDAADSVFNLKLSLLQKPVPASFCIQVPSFIVSGYTAGIDFSGTTEVWVAPGGVGALYS